MNKKLVGIILIGALVFTMLASLFSSLLYGGAIYQVTKAVKAGKKILFFHDHHIEGDNSIISGSRSYKVREVANWQRPILYRLFNDDLLKDTERSTLYLEWRDGIIPMRYGSLCKSLAHHEYDAKKGYESFDDGEDFFGHYFAWPYMCPVKKDKQDPVFRFTTIKNCDGRDYAHDTVLRVLARGYELADLKREIHANPKDSKRKDEYEKKIKNYRTAYYVKDIRDYGKNWYANTADSIVASYSALKPYISKKLAQELKKSLDAKKDRFEKMLKSVCNSTDMTNLFEDVVKALETKIGPKSIEDLHDAFLEFACQIVDMSLLKDLIVSTDQLHVIYCGGNHAEELERLLHKAGFTVTSCDTLKTHQLVSDSDALYECLRDFTCQELHNKKQRQDTPDSGSSFMDIAYASCLQVPGDFSGNEKMCSPHTFLHYAAEDGNQKMLEFLVNERHADPSIVNASGLTPLEIVEKKHTQLAKSLPQDLLV